MHNSLPNNTKPVTWDTWVDNDTEYAYLLTEGAPIKNFCPEYLVERHTNASDTLKGHLEALEVCNINVPHSESIPDFVIENIHSAKNDITKYVWENYNNQDEKYATLKRAYALASQLSGYKINFDHDLIKKSMHLNKVRQLRKTIMSRKHIRYDMFGTKTGRFSTHPGSFPILNFDSSLKKYILPANDLFLVIDFNAAEVRTLLALSGHQQPTIDIHEFNKKLLRSANLTRKQVKEKFFAWLYNPEASDDYFEKVYDKNIYKKYYDNGHITTPFQRTIEVEEKKALNYLIQSTTNDIVVEKCCEIIDVLSGYKSQVAFTVHDSIVIDIDRSDRDLIYPMLNKIMETRYGTMKCTAQLGKNYGELISI